MTEEEKAKAEAEAKAKAEAEAKAKADADAAAARNKPTDKEAELLKEVMQKKERIKSLEELAKKFEGVDLEAYAAYQAEKQKAEQEKAEAEKKRLEQAGEWDRLRKQMAEENEKVVKSVKEQLTAVQAELNQKQTTIIELTVGQAFANSKVISDELTLTPRKARAIFGSHFEVQNGEVVGFDKPAGADKRTPLVDAQGNHLPFEAALKKLVEADPDRDSILKAKIQPGSGANGGPAHKAPPANKGQGSGLDKIKAGVGGLLKQ